MRKGRRKLHDYMSVPALYFPFPYVAGETVVQEITVRIHDKFVAFGDLKGTTFNYAEMEDDSPRIIFMRNEVEPSRNYIVSVEAGSAYRVDAPMAPDDITITARCARLHTSEAAGLPVPGDLIPQNVRIAATFPAFSTSGEAE